jgi:hypothetical protein
MRLIGHTFFPIAAEGVKTTGCAELIINRRDGNFAVQFCVMVPKPVHDPCLRKMQILHWQIPLDSDFTL